MNTETKSYRVEVHTTQTLRMIGGETMTSWGADIRNPRYLSKREAWETAKQEMASDPAALVKVYVGCRKVWSNRPCRY